MKKLTVLLGLVSLVSLGLLGTGTATAAPPDSYTCEEGGPIPGGTYSKVVVEGSVPCFFAGAVTINGGLTVKPGAVLNDHAGSPYDAVINGNVFVGEGAVLGLGHYAPPIPTGTVVNGNIVATHPLTLYISGVTVNGNVTSSGGVTPSEFRNFPFKDNTVHGNLTIQGWQGGWFGVIRTHVDGNATIVNNESVLELTPVGCDKETPGACSGSQAGVDGDSTEIQTNVIGGNLKCFNNIPVAQVNIFDGGQLNDVAGQKLGECAEL